MKERTREVIRENLKSFILQKVRESTNKDKIYFFVKWSGLFELCRSYNENLLQLIDEMVEQGFLKKALIKGKLALYLPEYSEMVNKKTRTLKSEFENFLKSKVK
jgi:hypothetical protein